MSYKFEVESLGLVLNDGRMAMPGSVIYLQGGAPSHWARFGTCSRVGSAPKVERTLEVATPAPEPESDSDDLELLRLEYEEKTGKRPDGRWSEDRIRKELAE